MLSTFSGRSFLKRWVLSALIVKVKKMMITLMKEVKQGGGGELCNRSAAATVEIPPSCSC